MVIEARVQPRMHTREDVEEEEQPADPVAAAAPPYAGHAQVLDALNLDLADARAWPSDPGAARAEALRAFADARESWLRATAQFARAARAFTGLQARRHAAGQQHAGPSLSVPLRVVSRKPTEPTPPATKEATPAAETLPELSRLTRRQREVAVLIARGYSDAEIAQALVLTRGTASNHVAHILRRMGYRSRAQVAAWAVSHGLLAADGPDRSVQARHASAERVRTP
jgi:DNA-binding CsgD family transcriptional regulator